MTLAEITYQINRLLPQQCYLLTGKLSDYQNDLSSEESKYIDGYSDTRTIEFKAGRSIAKEAANFLGVKLLSIPMDSKGCPLWPTSVSGSISHKAGFCGALLGRDTSSIGLDIELAEHLHEDVWKTFTTKHEIEQADSCHMDESAFANMLFSAKEAFFKCLYPLYYPDIPTILNIKVKVLPINKYYFETKISFNNKEIRGGIILSSKILISWAISDR